jgi:riboflavin synthase
MFTGIVEEVGRVAAIERHATHARLRVGCTTVVDGVAIGDSIAVSGCCLTVTDLDGGGFSADLMAETLAATSAGDLVEGAAVNLERALRADARLGGHLVQGHVDGVGEVVGREQEPGTVWLSIAAPASLRRYLVPKGSVTVDGASLTVVDVAPDAGRGAEVAPDAGRGPDVAPGAGRGPDVAHDGDAGVVFRVALIPHTLEVTTFGDRGVGDRVNLEVDVIAKYVERLLAAGTDTPYDALEES